VLITSGHLKKKKEKRMKESGQDFVLSGPNLWPQKYQVTIPSGHWRLTHYTCLNRAKPSPKLDFRKFAELHVPLARPHLPTSRIAFRRERERERGKKKTEKMKKKKERNKSLTEN